VSAASTYELFEETNLYLFLGSLLLLTLQFQTVPIPVGIQMIPLTSLLALISPIFVIYRVERLPLMTCVVARRVG
jgi:hypothetical protein